MWAIVISIWDLCSLTAKKWEGERQHSSFLMFQKLEGDMHWCYEILKLSTGADY